VALPAIEIHTPPEDEIARLRQMAVCRIRRLHTLDKVSRPQRKGHRPAEWPTPTFASPDIRYLIGFLLVDVAWMADRKLHLYSSSRRTYGNPAEIMPEAWHYKRVGGRVEWLSRGLRGVVNEEGGRDRWFGLVLGTALEKPGIHRWSGRCRR